MASSAKRAKRGKFCVCGGPGMRSCTNTYHVDGISMHKFPENEEHRKLWVKFVRRHRPDFAATSSSFICSAHFDKACFATRYLVGVPDEVKPRSRYLLQGSVPTKDTVTQEEKPATLREKRLVRLLLIHSYIQIHSYILTILSVLNTKGKLKPAKM